MTKILIGADPELFIFEHDGKPVCADGLVPGTKYEPEKVKKGAIQVDGVAAEFNIDPADNEEDFYQNLTFVELQLLQKIQEKRKDVLLRAIPTIKFTKKQWLEIPPHSLELGCEPDFNAYTGKANPRPTTEKLMRTGSGHIHISWGQKRSEVKKNWQQHCASLVWHLDKHLYPQSLKWDTDKERQELYGKPGAFRPKPYGVEYRTLSNAWLRSEETIKYVFRVAKLCTEKWLDGFKPDMYAVEEFSSEEAF